MRLIVMKQAPSIAVIKNGIGQVRRPNYLSGIQREMASGGLRQLSAWIPRKHIIRIEVQRTEARLKFVMHGKLGHPLPRMTD